MITLGIETSCDECAVALLENDNLIAQLVASQAEEFSTYGGVVPELSSRLHIQHIAPVVARLFSLAKIRPDTVDLVAYTNRPGLMGSLLVGATYAKNFAWALRKPFIAVNHLLAHVIIAKKLHNDLHFPFLGVVASGGHTVLMLVKGYEEENIKILGTTLDDAIGECFDKVAKAYNLPYPGGIHVDRISREADSYAFNFPYPKLNSMYAGKYDLSYSGLKNAVINQRHQFLVHNGVDSVENILASFQRVAVGQLLKAVFKASSDFSIKHVVIGGGVAANSFLKKEMKNQSSVEFFGLPSELCGDNGHMIAYYGKELYMLRNKRSDNLTTGIVSRVNMFKHIRLK